MAADIVDLTGRTAVVTGASAGLGVHLARGLAAHGANVVLAARRLDRLEALAQEIGETGAQALAVRCDVTDHDQVEALLDAACERFGRVDVMVNNAGTAGDGGPVPEKTPPELFEQTIRVNLFGVWYGCQAAGRRMLTDGRGGSIINFASFLGLAGQQDYPPAYQASKAAVINLTRTLAVSWADRGIRVNAIAPGWFPTEMTEGFFSMPRFMESVLEMEPMGRVGRPEELVAPLLFLASDASSYVTGHTLAVNGGMSASLGAARHTPEYLDEFASVIPAGLGVRIGG